MGQQQQFDLVIVGAGFAGMAMLHRAREMGLSSVVFETGDDVGGTWYWNRYPGARCDVESMEYSYQFSDELQQQWSWSERFAAQPEILRYARHVADRYELRRDIRFKTRVTQASYDEQSARWTVDAQPVEGASAQPQQVSGRWLIMATGCLSSANVPHFEGIERFAGDKYHTGQWPHEPVDFTGKRVGIIGTGSSAIQSIPIIASQAQQLFVFQRTPSYSVPARNAPLDPAHEARIKADYPAFRKRNALIPRAFGSEMPPNTASVFSVDEQRRREIFDERWTHGGLHMMSAFGDLMIDPKANALLAEFVRDKIRSIVRDPQVAEKLCPRQVIGTKRLCVDTDFYETFNRPNVELVDLRDGPIERFTETGIVCAGTEYPLDCIVFATGFDAMTGSLLRVDIRGREGKSLRDAWEAGPRTYLGLGVVGFPNLFTITGPGSPSVLTNMLVSIEQHVGWIADCIGYMREHQHREIEATLPAQDAWVDHVNAVAARTLYPQANSWYMGSNIPGKTRVFMPLIGFPDYARKCDEVSAAGYEGFVFDAPALS
jgi:cation diffusion facilitator CzcD-associated flavoprotein CzcO